MNKPLSLHDCHYSCSKKGRSVLVDSLQRSAPLVTSPIPIPISTHVLVFSRIYEVKKQPNENEDRLRKYLRPAAVLHTTHTHMHKLEMVAGLTNRSPAR
ncbi:unnamed protein product [Fusarium graminearum]|uniref:Chromosome 4, complete genome n=1 Tax=Gibberella zeae (strain ATCC MYA-4620 / CBS 123657 / FGSC 9075 / NRRL 31084 / PH-1) TaxID=229533 RepID=A0A098DST0_GIBZE|nr:unnamed protein product [Fusarium graminearum]